MIRKCNFCGREFITNTASRESCSDACAKKEDRMLSTKLLTKKCVICGKSTKITNIRNIHICSEECDATYRELPIVFSKDHSVFDYAVHQCTCGKIHINNTGTKKCLPCSLGKLEGYRCG